jgi:hypothetical protein
LLAFAPKAQEAVGLPAELTRPAKMMQLKGDQCERVSGSFQDNGAVIGAERC